LNALLAGRGYDNVGIRIHWNVLYVLALALVPEPRPKSFSDHPTTSTPPRWLQFRVEIKERRLPSKREKKKKRKEEEFI
jgi:hypothetical protein